MSIDLQPSPSSSSSFSFSCSSSSSSSFSFSFLLVLVLPLLLLLFLVLVLLPLPLLFLKSLFIFTTVWKNVTYGIEKFQLLWLCDCYFLNLTSQKKNQTAALFTFIIHQPPQTNPQQQVEGVQVVVVTTALLNRELRHKASVCITSEMNNEA